MKSSRKLLKEPYIVPQNSVSTFNQRANHGVNKSAQCPHCEIMAKNFLYLESLIRNNYNPKIPCKLCFASLKYLQFVNKSIMSVFGSCDAVVNAAKCFFGPVKSSHSFKAHCTKRKPVVIVPKKTKRIKAGGGGIAIAHVSHPEGNGDFKASMATQVTAAANSHEYSANPKSTLGKTLRKLRNKKLLTTKNIPQQPENVTKTKPLRRSTSTIKKTIKRLR